MLRSFYLEFLQKYLTSEQVTTLKMLTWLLHFQKQVITCLGGLLVTFLEKIYQARCLSKLVGRAGSKSDHSSNHFPLSAPSNQSKAKQAQLEFRVVLETVMAEVA